MLEKRAKLLKKAIMAEMKQHLRKVLSEFANMLESLNFTNTEVKAKAKKAPKIKRLSRPKKLAE